MKLGLKQVPQAISVLGQPSSPLYDKVLSASFSMPAAIALLVHREATRHTDAGAEGLLDGVSHGLLTEVEGCLSKAAPPGTKGSIFKKRPREFYLIKGRQDLLSTKFDFFCERFRRGIANGRRDGGYKDLREAFFEMSDNVVSHAGVDATNGHLGIVGYETTPAGGCFTVCDTGCGFVESLALNEKWRSISTHADAIDAVVKRQATSRVGESSGGGFKGLFSALVQLNSLTLLRSGDCLAAISTTSRGPEIVFHPHSSLAGSQVSVFFSRAGVPVENFH